jgi:hypothetical protein
MDSKALLLVALVYLSAACSKTVDVEIEDESSFINLETSFPLPGENFNRLRLRGASVSGDFSQSIDSGERIDFDGNKFVLGPAEVDGDIDLTYFSMAVGWDRPEGTARDKPLSSSFYVGIAQTRFDLELGNGVKTISESDNTNELYLQYGIYKGLTDALDIGFSGALSLGGEGSISEIDLKLEYELNQHLSVAGGYRWFSYDYDSNDFDSDVEVEIHGPFLGLAIPF